MTGSGAQRGKTGSVYGSLDNASYNMLDKVGLADAFESRGIPSIVFPLIIIIAVLAVAFVVLMPPAEKATTLPPVAYCGDGACDSGESSVTCPSDCPVTEEVSKKTVVLSAPSEVRLSLGKVLGSNNPLKVTLHDKSGKVIKQLEISDPNLDIKFTGITAESVYVRAISPQQSTEAISEIIDLTGDKDTVYIRFPEDFQMRDLQDLELPPKGTKIVIPLASDSVFVLTKGGTETLEVGLYDTEGNLVATRTINASSTEVVFEDVELTEGYIAATLWNGTTGTTGVIDFTEGTTVYIAFPGDFVQTGNVTDVPETTTEGITVETLVCLTKGDFDGDREISRSDYLMFEDMFGSEVIRAGVLPQNWEICADMNGDYRISSDDLECMAGIVDGRYSSPEDCDICARTSSVDICNDGNDNNCDGQNDRETFTDGELLGTSADPSDACDCNANTPCNQYYSTSGLPEEVAQESEKKRCVSLNGGAYSWYTESEWQCSSSRDGWELRCAGSSYECVYDEGKWAWSSQGSESCDGYDNDGDNMPDDGCDDDMDGYADSLMGCPDGSLFWGWDYNPAYTFSYPSEGWYHGERQSGFDEGSPFSNVYSLGNGFIMKTYSCNGRSGDCNDDYVYTYPGATEYCDYADNDCDGEIDEQCKEKE